MDKHVIVICSANEAIRERWRNALADDRPFQECSSVEELYQCLAACHPPVLVVHASLPGLQLTEEKIRTDFKGSRVLLLADTPREDEAFQMLRTGVYGYSNTYMATNILREAIETIIKGDVWMGKRLTHYLAQCLEDDLQGHQSEAPSSPANHQFSQLTAREKEILTFIAQGDSNKVISTALGISERTVKAHLTSIYEKLGTPDRLHLAVMLGNSRWKSQ